jgi:hypothetical protein
MGVLNTNMSTHKLLDHLERIYSMQEAEINYKMQLLFYATAALDAKLSI